MKGIILEGVISELGIVVSAVGFAFTYCDLLVGILPSLAVGELGVRPCGSPPGVERLVLQYISLFWQLLSFILRISWVLEYLGILILLAAGVWRVGNSFFSIPARRGCLARCLQRGPRPWPIFGTGGYPLPVRLQRGPSQAQVWLRRSGLRAHPSPLPPPGRISTAGGAPALVLVGRRDEHVFGCLLRCGLLVLVGGEAVSG